MENGTQVLEAPAAPAKPKAKKAAKPKAKPAKAAKPTNGIRKPQLAILKALAKAGRSLTRGQIADKAKVDVAWLTSWIGSHDEGVRKANDKKHFPSLLTLGLVKYAPGDEDGAVAYQVTAKGEKVAKA